MARRGRPLRSPGSATRRALDDGDAPGVGPGRDKPVPYEPAPGVARRGDPCGRPDPRRAGVGRWRRPGAGPGRDKPVPYEPAPGVARRGDPCGRPDPRRGRRWAMATPGRWPGTGQARPLRAGAGVARRGRPLRSPGSATRRRWTMATPGRWPGTGTSPVPYEPAPAWPVGATLAVARIRDAPKLDDGDARALARDGDKPVPYEPAPGVARRGDPCGRPDPRRAGVGRWRRMGVGPGRGQARPPTSRRRAWPVGATLAVARIRDAPALDDGDARALARDGTSPSPTSRRRRGP